MCRAENESTGTRVAIIACIKRFSELPFFEQNAPTWVWFINEDGNPEELPKTASGKVMKHVLRKWGRELAARDLGRVGKD